MAEATVGLLIGKLGAALANEAATYGASLLCKEASALKGLFGEIRKAERELESMKAFLRDTEKFRDTNETTSIFVNRVRELSFRIEDVVDELMYKLEDNKHGGFAANTKKRITHVRIWHRLALELREINAELEDTTKRRDRYATTGMQRYSGNGDHARPTNQTTCFAREEDLVGIEGNASKLKGWLVDDLDERNTKIATVWGMAGVGKTTLVDHVYKIVKLDFDAAAWITVSKSYQVEELLKKIAREFGISIDSSNMDMRRTIDAVRNHLEGKRFLLVLDDVWEQYLCINNILEIFPTNCIGRFVLTSRNFEVAALATSNCTIQLEPLGENHSWKLFCKLAFRNKHNKRCPSELHDLCVKFLQKCEGLPIAIACIGRLLSFKPTTYPEWETVYKELESHSANNAIRGVDTILKVSLEDLPYELKNCFLHCALFPEGFLMKSRRLIRYWITSGFIKEEVNKTLEQVAEGYLCDLVNRSLLQIVTKNEFGRLKRCQMHDVIRHFAIRKAEKESFGKVYGGHSTFSVDGTRRLSIQSTDIEFLNQSRATCLRAVHVFTSSIDVDLLRLILASSVLLSTLDLQGTQVKKLPNEVFSLFNLRFLGLRYTLIQSLPEAVGRLQNLEVLDAWCTCLLSLPKAVTKLKKLRYLFSSIHITDAGVFTDFGGVKVPKGLRNLTKLYVLQSVKASSEVLRDVSDLTELRTFAVDGVTNEHSLSLRNALVNMINLVSLSITASKNEVLPLEELRLPETLSKLRLKGQLEKKWMPRILSSWLHLNNLTNLYLRSSNLDENSFASLMVFHNLSCLSLYSAYEGKKLCISARSFPRLLELHIGSAPQLSQVEIEEGALGSLIKLWITWCLELKRLPHGIEYLGALEELYLVNTADEFIEMLVQESETNECKEELMKISHIRKVIVESTEKNFWKRIVSRNVDEFAV